MSLTIYVKLQIVGNIMCNMLIVLYNIDQITVTFILLPTIKYI